MSRIRFMAWRHHEKVGPGREPVAHCAIELAFEEVQQHPQRGGNQHLIHGLFRSFPLQNLDTLLLDKWVATELHVLDLVRELRQVKHFEFATDAIEGFLPVLAECALVSVDQQDHAFTSTTSPPLVKNTPVFLPNLELLLVMENMTVLMRGSLKITCAFGIFSRLGRSSVTVSTFSKLGDVTWKMRG
jgi:hypothetical protein